MVRFLLALALGALCWVVPGSGDSPESLLSGPRALLRSMLRSEATKGEASKSTLMGGLTMMDFTTLPAIQGKTLSEKTLPLDRARADELCTGD